MNITIYTQSTGEIVRLISCPDEEVSFQVQDSEGYVEGHFDSRAYYWNGEEMVAIPTQPTSDHVWDAASKTWTADLSGAKARVFTAIEVERDRRIEEPIEYDNILIDGFKRSQENIAAKLATLNERERLGLSYPTELCVWRDSANVTHTFADHASYKDWLAGVAIALEERGTLAYAWSWQKKGELDAATTLEAILAIDLES